jgi:hypothetical protein
MRRKNDNHRTCRPHPCIEDALCGGPIATLSPPLLPACAIFPCGTCTNALKHTPPDWGRLAQLVERFVYTEDVGSSSLSSPTIYPPKSMIEFWFQRADRCACVEKSHHKSDGREGPGTLHEVLVSQKRCTPTAPPLFPAGQQSLSAVKQGCSDVRMARCVASRPNPSTRHDRRIHHSHNHLPGRFNRPDCKTRRREPVAPVAGSSWVQTFASSSSRDFLASP